MLLLIASCSVQKRAIKRVKWVDDRHPITLVRWCADNVPVRADTVLIPGKEIVIPGTLVEVDCDTVTDTGYKDRVVKVPCPPSTHRTDTFTITKVDSAALVVLRHEKDSIRNVLILTSDKLSRVKKTRNTLWAILGGLVVGAAIVVVAKFKLL